MRYPKVFEDETLQKFYVKVRKNLRRDAISKGQKSDDVADHRFAEMLTLRRPMRTMTDREFYEGQGTLDKQFKGDAEGLNMVVQNARRHGYNPNPNDVYVPTMAKFPGDPKAFISDGRHQIKKTLVERNQSGYGVVNHERKPDRDPLKDVKLAPDVAIGMARKEARKNGGKIPLARVEEIRTQHAYKM